MRSARALLAALWLCWGLPMGAAAAGKPGGGGLLEDVDPEAHTVTVGERTLSVASWSVLRDSRGRTLSLEELAETDGPWVTWAARPAVPHPLLERLTVEDDAD